MHMKQRRARGIDVIRYPEMWKNDTEDFNTDQYLANVIDPAGVLSQTQMSDRVYELPTMKPKLVGQKA